MKEVASGETTESAIAGRIEACDREAGEASSALRGLLGWSGLGAGWSGAVVVAAVTVFARWWCVPFLYAGPREVILHLALEIVCGAAVWLVLWAALNGAYSADRALPNPLRLPARIVALLACGFGIAAFLYQFVVRRSARFTWTSPFTWQIILALGGIGVSVAMALALRIRFRKQRLAGGALMLATLALHVGGLQRYVRHYGNLQTLLLAAVAALMAIGMGFAVDTARRRRALTRFAWCSLGTGALWVALLGSEPTNSARRAVLVWGGVAKRVMLSVVWPLADHDGDTSPALFWGVDPDDHRADVTPRTGLPPWPPSSHVNLDAAPTHEQQRNLLWIIVDTVRRDSFDAALAADPEMRAAFASFADHRSYVSCSSRTSEVTAQLYGRSRCDDRTFEGGTRRSLLDLLRDAGYRDSLLTVPDIPLPFTKREVLADDEALLARARQLMASAGDGEALFLHLRGGHADYLAPGGTLRERYENQLRAALAGVARLVRDTDSARWAVVALGDHGEAFGEHLSSAHATTLYEEAIRTPLLLRAPNVRPGPRDEPVSCANVPWLTLHALGMLDREPAPLKYQYAALDIAPGELGHLQGDRLRSLRAGNLKVVWSSDLGLWEFYDLDADPGELHSLADTRPGDFALLRSTLEKLSRECPPEPPTVATREF